MPVISSAETSIKEPTNLTVIHSISRPINRPDIQTRNKGTLLISRSHHISEGGGTSGADMVIAALKCMVEANAMRRNFAA
jgi:hypothetical protein